MVSVIIPTYKRIDGLNRALESILNQTYTNFEIIVVDDNDENSNYRIATEKFMNKFINEPRVHYLKHKKNLNGAAARNTGIKYARGEFVTFLDDDDFYENNRFEILIPELKNSDKNIGVILSGFKWIKKDKVYKKGLATNVSDPLYELLNSRFSVGSGSNFILKASVFNKVEGFDENFTRNQDIEFLVRVAEHFSFISNNKYLLNIQVDSEVQNKTSINNMIEIKRMFINKYRYLLKQYDENEIVLNNLRKLMYLIYYYDEQDNYQNLIKDYKTRLDLKGRLEFYGLKSKLRLRKYFKKYF